MDDLRQYRLALRRLIERRGLTITEAARLAQIHRSTLANVLNGRRSLRSDQTVRLLKALKVWGAVEEAVVAVLDREGEQIISGFSPPRDRR